MVDLVKMAVRDYDCNAYEVLDEISLRYGLCYLCLQAASQFDDEGYCPSCSVDEDEDLEEEPGLIELSTEGWIPYDNLSAEQVRCRAHLQERLRSFKAAPKELLVARYYGRKHPESDVENLLFYHIGSDCFAGAFRRGVQFEESPSQPPIGPNVYQYYLKESARVKAPASWGRVARLRHFHEVKVAAPSEGWAQQIELDLRSLGLPTETVYAGPFEVVLELRSPAGVAPKIRPARLKELLDGVVASHREGLKGNLGDHRCVAGIVRWSRGKGSDWTLSGEIWSLKPYTGAAPLIYLQR